MNTVRLLAVAAAMCFLAGPAAGKTPAGGDEGLPAGKPTTAPAMPEDAPWGKEVDGLACRLIVRPSLCPGQPVTAVVEIKNVSKRERQIVNILDMRDSRWARMEATGPDGKRLKMHSDGQVTPTPSSLLPLRAGEVKRFEFPDLNAYFDIYDWAVPGKPGRTVRRSQFAASGKYTLRYVYVGKKLPRQMISGETNVNGRPQKTYHTFDDETLAAMWEGELPSNDATFTVEKIAAADLTVHEWGVFTVYTDMKYANADRKAEWSALPEFFYRQFPTYRLRWEPAAWDKPIVYFYTARPAMRVEVKVGFGDGSPVAWWPCAALPVDDGMGPRGGPDQKRPLFRELSWDAWLGKAIPTTTRFTEGPAWRDVEEFPLPDDSWLKQARLAAAANRNAPAPLTVTGTRMQRGAPWNSTQSETEQFLFYDGLVPAPDGLRCTAAGERAVTLRNAGKLPIADLFVVDNRAGRDGNATLFAHHAAAIEPGAEAKIDLAAAPAGKWPAEGAAAVRRVLLAAGLFEAEADSLLAIWRPGLFLRPGLSAFYVLPRAEYDRMLPMTVTPSPGAMERVGVALHVGLEDQPTLTRRARQLVGELDANTVKQRENATQELRAMGPAAWRVLREALAGKLSEEARIRAQAVLDAADATEYLRSAAEQTTPKPVPPARNRD